MTQIIQYTSNQLKEMYSSIADRTNNLSQKIAGIAGIALLASTLSGCSTDKLARENDNDLAARTRYTSAAKISYDRSGTSNGSGNTLQVPTSADHGIVKYVTPTGPSYDSWKKGKVSTSRPNE